MKRIAVWVIAVIFFTCSTPVFAAGKGEKGPNSSEKAYEHANENAKFKRTEDVKNKEVEKSEKKAEEETRKANKEAEKEKRKAEKEAKKKQKEMDKAARKAKKGLKK